MTLNEIAYNIKNIVEGGISGEDSTLSLRQVKSMVNYHRAQLLAEYTKFGKKLSKSLLQTVSSNLADGWFEIPAIVGFEKNRGIGEIILRSEAFIPAEEQISVPIINESERQFFESSRFAPSSDKYYATLSYNAAAVGVGTTSGTESMIHIYSGAGELFIDDTWTAYVSIIASNPSNVPGFNDATSHYPLPDELVASLIKTLLSVEFAIYLKTDPDTANNSMNDANKQYAQKALAESYGQTSGRPRRKK